MNNRENKRGRRTKMTPEIINKLEQVFSLGGTDEEACFYANIGKTTLYKYQLENKEFAERKEALKKSTILKARQVLIQGLEGNPELALKYLERKCRAEFGLRAETVIELDKELFETLEKINGLLP